jgi:hypothetical protein
MNEIEKVEKMEVHALTAKEIRAQVNLIQEVMKSVMKKGVHYGTVPGCGDKPTLLKPGAEKLLMTFRISPDLIVDDLSTDDEAHFRIRCVGSSHQGVRLGSGVGEASSNEEKYMWRKAVCEEEYNATPEDRKREKWYRGQSKPYCVPQIRTNKADVANTVLKMAKKRAMVDLALTVTAASDIFMQDIEDLPPEVREEIVDDEVGDGAPTRPSEVKRPSTTRQEPSKPQPGRRATPAQINAVSKIVARLNIVDAIDMILDEKYGISSVANLSFDVASQIIGSNGDCLK